jgi:hypothetical protein
MPRPTIKVLAEDLTPEAAQALLETLRASGEYDNYLEGELALRNTDDRWSVILVGPDQGSGNI